MAIIKFGGGVAGISGKIGGTVFGRNKAGAYARNWAKPVNPGTPSQSAARVIFAAGSAGWAGLTTAERDDWNAQAQTLERVNRLGETYTPSGRQYYLEIYNSLQQAGMPALSSPVVSPVAPTLGKYTLTATQTAGVLTALSIAEDIPGTAPDYIIEAAPLQPNAKTNVNTQFRQILVDNGPFPINILAAYTALFGTVAAVGDVCHLRLTGIDPANGYRSAPLLVEDIVA